MGIRLNYFVLFISRMRDKLTQQFSTYLCIIWTITVITDEEELDGALNETDATSRIWSHSCGVYVMDNEYNIP